MLHKYLKFEVFVEYKTLIYGLRPTLGEDMNKDILINGLEKDLGVLRIKMTKALENEDFGTYRNLLKAVSDIEIILSKSEWKTMFSEYITDGKKQVAVWEQNQDGEIRKHKVWNVESNTPLIKAGVIKEMIKIE